MLQGKIIGDTFVVIDVFALPVEGTETRVNAQAEAYEYMVDFADSTKVSSLWRHHPEIMNTAASSGCAPALFHAARGCLGRAEIGLHRPLYFA